MAFFRHRSPAFLIPQRKPGPAHRIEFNPSGQFSKGLISLLMFDGGASASGIHDKIVPSRVFTYTGTTQALAPVQFGGMGFQTGGNSNDQINYATALPSMTEWTISALGTFDGAASGAYAGNLVIASDSGLTTYVAASGAGAFTSSQGTWTSQIDMATLKGPHRVTITNSLAALSLILYTDGKQNGATIASDFAITVGILFSGWPWTASDLFIWNRALTPAEVSAHNAAPYSMLRPREDIRRRGGVPFRVLSPPRTIQIWDH